LLFIYFDGTTGKWRNLGPGSDDVPRFHGGLATIVELHRDGVWRHRGSSFDVVDFDLLEEKKLN